jgi:hypothetical protein
VCCCANVPAICYRACRASIAALAQQLGYFFPVEPRTAFEKLECVSAGGTADYSGITHERRVAENEVFCLPSE